MPVPFGSALNPFENEAGAGGEVDVDLVAVVLAVVEGEGFEDLLALNNVVAAEAGGVGVEDEAVCAGCNIDGIVLERFVRVEVEAEEQAFALEGDGLVAFVDEAELDGIVSNCVALADKVNHGLIEVGEEAEF